MTENTNQIIGLQELISKNQTTDAPTISTSIRMGGKGYFDMGSAGRKSFHDTFTKTKN